MADYAALIKRLRRCGQFKCRECEYEQMIGCRSTLNVEAADAIEELQKCLDGVTDDNDNLCEKIEELNKPKWISVKERLPEYGTNVRMSRCRFYSLEYRGCMLHITRCPCEDFNPEQPERRTE